jgi:antibiotic biosynthesis monooxygenase (ABM) superfamily enzyme
MTDDDRHLEWRTADLSDIAARELPAPDMVTVVIQHDVVPASVAAYEQWLARIIPVAARFPGHRGVSVMRPPAGSSRYTVTLRFDTLEHAEDWLRSTARRELVHEIETLLDRAEKVDTVTGIEFWFAPPPTAPQLRPPPYKQFLLTLSVIYPLTMLVPWALRPLHGLLPVLRYAWIDRLLIATVIVGLMTYVVMPRYTRLVARWLYR